MTIEHINAAVSALHFVQQTEKQGYLEQMEAGNKFDLKFLHDLEERHKEAERNLLNNCFWKGNYGATIYAGEE